MLPQKFQFLGSYDQIFHIFELRIETFSFPEFSVLPTGSDKVISFVNLSKVINFFKLPRNFVNYKIFDFAK